MTHLRRPPLVSNIFLLRHFLSRRLPASDHLAAPPRHFLFPPCSLIFHFSSYAELLSAANLSLLGTDKAGASVSGGGGGGRHSKVDRKLIADLSKELAAVPHSEMSKVTDILEAKGEFLLVSDETKPMLELMFSLRFCPRIALQVFKWKKGKVDKENTFLFPEEYAKAITLAGRIKDTGLAFELFTEATNRNIRTTAIYNALMTSYMYNGFNKKSISLFKALKKDRLCRPTIVTFNILLSIFGHSMMIDYMEEVVRLIKYQNLVPNISTYNTLIAGYVTAWMWDRMENTFSALEESSITPNTQTYLLMLRGYAYAGNLKEMERFYGMVKTDIIGKNANLVRVMIYTYSKSSAKDRITKIEALLKLIPKDDYRPWLNVILIRAYAEENLMERMENHIAEALERNTKVVTIGIMKAIIGTYFRLSALDRLEMFVKQAELAGWRLCRSLYHTKMVMYSRQNRLEDMESVLDEMKNFNFDRTRKTFWILYKAYSSHGKVRKVNRLLAQMLKSGHLLPTDEIGCS